MFSNKYKITKYLIPAFLVVLYVTYAGLKLASAQHEVHTDSTSVATATEMVASAHGEASHEGVSEEHKAEKGRCW
jgi:hypothetical protein